ncbi:replication/maintenance protein RepL [Vibrio sp. M260112]|uniref:replication/maintenance protein RepL n=1 Tax=Vibrio sp. M260112 TaxID=3020895 RepID=UPI002F4075C9
MKEECGVSKQTVVTVMKAMQEANLLHRIRNDLYTLDADFIFAGKSDDRLNIMFTYENIKELKNKGN